MEFSLSKQSRYRGYLISYFIVALTAVNPVIQVASGNTRLFTLVYLGLALLGLFIAPFDMYRAFKERIFFDLRGIRREGITWTKRGRTERWAVRWEEIDAASVRAGFGPPNRIDLLLKDGTTRSLPLGGWASVQIDEGPEWDGKVKSDAQVATFVNAFPFVQLLSAHGIHCRIPSFEELSASRRVVIALVAGILLVFGFLLAGSENSLALGWRLAAGALAGGVVAIWVFKAKRSYAEAIAGGFAVGLGVALVSGRLPL